VDVHELVIHFDMILPLPDLDRRRRRVHDSREAGRLTLKIRIVLLKVVRGAFLLAFGSESKRSDLRAQQNPDAIQIGALSSCLRKAETAISNATDGPASSRFLASGLAVRDAFPEGGKAAVSQDSPIRQCRRSEISRLGRRLLGMTLTVTLSPILSTLTGTLRLSNEFLSDHSMKNSVTPPPGWRPPGDLRMRIANGDSLTLPTTSSVLL
jgi:hypothetical protein